MAKLTAKGNRAGEAVTLECCEKGNRIEVLKNGKADADAEIILQAKILELRGKDSAGLPEFSLNQLCSYWVALHESYFDEPPAIKITGDFDTLGLPYGREDTSQVVF